MIIKSACLCIPELDGCWVPIVFTIEWGVVIEIWKCSPISFEHVPFWCLLIDPHQTTYQSNIGIWWRKKSPLNTHLTQWEKILDRWLAQHLFSSARYHLAMIHTIIVAYLGKLYVFNQPLGEGDRCQPTCPHLLKVFTSERRHFVFGGPLILIMLVLGSHKHLDQLEHEATP